MDAPAYAPLQPRDPAAPGMKRGVELLCNQKRPRGLAAAEQPSSDPREAQFALQYLDAFGYLPKPLADWDKLQAADLTKAIKLFQGAVDLSRTGVLCAKVVRAMEAPRCGCPDVERPHLQQYAAVKKWAKAMLPAWRKRSLTYAIVDYLPAFRREDQDAIIAAAFAAWTTQGNIDAVQVPGANGADIVISTGQGPRSNFDGPGGTLAWAYLPDGNDQQLLLKFDLGETWVASAAQRGIVLGNVACHEIGHTFGLSHSTVASALMAPIYNAAVAVPQLNDDVARFQVRYGARPATTPAPTPTPTPPPTTPAAAVARIAIEGPAAVWHNGKQLA